MVSLQFSRLAAHTPYTPYTPFTPYTSCPTLLTLPTLHSLHFLPYYTPYTFYTPYTAYTSSTYEELDTDTTPISPHKVVAETDLLDLGGKTNVLRSLLGRMELVSPPGLGQGGQGGHTGGVRVRPLEVEESVLEAVGGDLLGSHLSSCLNHRPLGQVSQQVGEAGALQENISTSNGS